MPKRPPKPDPEQVAVLQKSDYFNETQGKILGEDLKRSHRFDVHHNMYVFITGFHKFWIFYVFN